MREGGEGRNGNGIVMREKCVYKGGNNHGKNMVENVVKMFDRFEENVRIDYVAVRGGQWKHYRRCLETEFVKLF